MLLWSTVGSWELLSPLLNRHHCRRRFIVTQAEMFTRKVMDVKEGRRFGGLRCSTFIDARSRRMAASIASDNTCSVWPILKRAVSKPFPDPLDLLSVQTSLFYLVFESKQDLCLDKFILSRVNLQFKKGQFVHLKPSSLHLLALTAFEQHAALPLVSSPDQPFSGNQRVSQLWRF